MLSIRQKVFWVFDLLGLFVAFLAAARIAPFFHRLLSLGGPLYGGWIEFFTPAQSGGVFPPLREYFWVFLVSAPATVAGVGVLGGHLPIRRQRPLRILLFSVAAPLAGVALLSTMFYVLKSDISRLIVLSFAAVSFVVILGSRLVGRAWYFYTLREGMYTQEVAIVGTPQAARLVVGRLLQAASLEYKLVGYFPIGATEAGALQVENGLELPVLGNIGDLEQVLIHQAIQRMVLVLPDESSHWLEGALKACDYFRIAVDILPEAILTASLDDLVSSTSGTSGRLPALTLAPQEVQSDWLFIKRVLDVCLSGTLLLLLSPLFALIALAIKLSTPHLPVFYPWRVVGYRGRRFTGYKFTTMVAGADMRLAELASLNEMTGPVFKIAHDPRVTPLGRFLRKYSLNELPQLWSVLKGDMSLVGPRPAWPHELERYELWQKRKLSAQPGITCFWQIRGRNRINNFDDWVMMDLEYIRNRSLWLDFKILAWTAWVVVRGTGS